MSKVKIGIQLYTLRDYIKTPEDFDETLGYLGAFGVRDVQISAIGDFHESIQAPILKKHDMSVCVTHKSFGRMLTELDAMIEEHKLIGCDCMGIGSMPDEYRENIDTLREFIAKAEKIGKKLRENGMHFAYHNHAFELQKIDGERTIFDVLLQESDPELFWFIPDVCWLQVGGVNPAEYLERLKGRVKVLHFKDYVRDGEKTKFVTLGEGLIDLDACYRACMKLDIPYIMYEQDIDWVDGDAKKACRLSYDKMLEIQGRLDK